MRRKDYTHPHIGNMTAMVYKDSSVAYASGNK